jgi:acyl transferase domain-containing protein
MLYSYGNMYLIGVPRYACVNSFGFSGTNANAVMKEAPKLKIDSSPSPPSNHYILPLSACPKTPNALRDMVTQFHSHLKAANEDQVDGILSLK